MSNLRDEFLFGGKTYAQWSLEKRLATEFRATRADVEYFRDSVVKEVRRGMETLPAFREELRHQHNSISLQLEALSFRTEAGLQEIGEAIDRAASTIGAALTEIYWSLERHRYTTARPRTNTSIDLFEQGLACYEVGDYNDAEECLIEAIKYDRRNYSAAGYLGMIAVIRDDEVSAKERFERALRYAGQANDTRHQALSLLHLAHVAASGKLKFAASLAMRASILQPMSARFVYEHARLRARLLEITTAIDLLNSAISLEEAYWTAPLLDPAFKGMRDDVYALLTRLKDERRRHAQTVLSALKERLSSQIRADSIPLADLHAVNVRLGEVIDEFMLDNYFQLPAVAEAATRIQVKSSTLA
jgi:tetratricopeptide (TPR) repeat protein